MSKPKIFGIGVTGLVGSRIVELLTDYEITSLSSSMGVDITVSDTLSVIREDTEHDWIIHMAAKADVDGCEKDKELGEAGDAYKINVLGTQNVVEAAQVQDKKLIYISTDFVFDGKKPPEHGYTEEDKPNPVNWYAETKYKAEEIVRNSGLHYQIIRTAYPFQTQPFADKKDFLHAIKDRLAGGLPVAAITDHIMTPTFLDDLAKSLDMLIQKDAQGIFHVVGSQSLTPHEAALLIAETFGYDKNLISETTREAFFKDRATRPFDLTLNNDKIEQLGVTMLGFKEAIELRIEKYD